VRTSSPAAYRLFHEGTLALANVEANGFRVDVDYLQRAIKKSEKKIKRMEEKLREDDVYKTWRKHYGANTNLGSDRQLAHILFSVMGYPCRERTEGGELSAKEANLVDIDLPFIKTYRRCEKLKKARGTFLQGILDFTTSDGMLHSNFNLNIAATFRSSVNDPNLQNFPIRDEELSKLIRSCFIPRDGHRLVESDFSGIEVGIACCYNKDPKLIKDYTEGDMHRDMAIKCYQLALKEVSKTIRYCAKNMFVFPEFYGSYYIDCSRNLWEAIERMELKTTSDLSLREHLSNIGITKLGRCDPDQTPRKGTFEAHIKAVEDEFWNVRYRVYNEWKKKTWEEYKRKGYCQLLSGFVCSRNSDGLVLNRKQVINYQIQGAAFHCLLWCLIEMDKWLRENNMRSKIVNQIHDSIIGDVHEDELEDYTAKIQELMTVAILKFWKWIIVPLSVEIEMTEVNGNWSQKKKVEL